MGGLNVVCLISGGKDSLFSILHCQKNGHKVVALANLHPPLATAHDQSEDMDSYMYQTIGHAVIPCYEQALDLPLYRQEISGSAANQDKCYGPSADVSTNASMDETEDLVPLLRKVKVVHPDVNAVSTGAILSDYQRTRVESVAIRLGLTPLSYLWQWPLMPPHTPSSLLEDMAAVGQDSRIIKVASGGLDESHLWENVADPRTIRRLDKAVKRFGSADDGAILGEGGEYETLAIAGPRPLWKGRLHVAENQRSIVAGEAGSASVQVLAPQIAENTRDQCGVEALRTPPALEPHFHNILARVQQQELDMEASDDPETRHEEDKDAKRSPEASTQLLLRNLVGDGPDAGAQMHSIMSQLKGQLADAGLHFTDVTYTAIILRNIEDFATVNPIYGKHFAYPNPPARLTLACAGVLPPNKDIMLSVTCTKPSDSIPRRGLHVQSRSYWAPANIGPYSQAISVPATDGQQQPYEILYVAGQIPLVPATMEVPPPSSGTNEDVFAYQAVLAQQHFVRIGRAMGVGPWIGGIVFLSACSAETASLRMQIVRRAWAGLHAAEVLNTGDADGNDDESNGFDVWDLKQGRAGMHGTQSCGDQTPSLNSRSPIRVPPLSVVLVDALPRGVLVEWAVYGARGARNSVASPPHMRHLMEVFGDLI